MNIQNNRISCQHFYIVNRLPELAWSTVNPAWKSWAVDEKIVEAEQVKLCSACWCHNSSEWFDFRNQEPNSLVWRLWQMSNQMKQMPGDVLFVEWSPRTGTCTYATFGSTSRACTDVRSVASHSVAAQTFVDIWQCTQTSGSLHVIFVTRHMLTRKIWVNISWWNMANCSLDFIFLLILVQLQQVMD